MLLYPSVSEMLEQINSRYLLVNVIAKRARVLSDRALANGEPLEEKPVSAAVKEIAAGKIKVTTSARF